MTKLVRTEKEFTKENLPLDFLRRATSLGGLHGRPLKMKEEDFEVEERWKGVSADGGTKYPWRDGDETKGFVKTRNGVWIKNKTDFDTNVTVSEDGRLQGYFKSKGNLNASPDQIEWCNLLIEYGFLEIHI